ncbi:MAG: hypothetical protein AAF292_17150 [Pseudomonadota bacterium]
MERSPEYDEFIEKLEDEDPNAFELRKPALWEELIKALNSIVEAPQGPGVELKQNTRHYPKKYVQAAIANLAHYESGEPWKRETKHGQFIQNLCSGKKASQPFRPAIFYLIHKIPEYEEYATRLDHIALGQKRSLKDAREWAPAKTIPVSELLDFAKKLREDVGVDALLRQRKARHSSKEPSESRLTRESDVPVSKVLRETGAEVLLARERQPTNASQWYRDEIARLSASVSGVAPEKAEKYGELERLRFAFCETAESFRNEKWITRVDHRRRFLVDEVRKSVVTSGFSEVHEHFFYVCQVFRLPIPYFETEEIWNNRLKAISDGRANPRISTLLALLFFCNRVSFENLLQGQDIQFKYTLSDVHDWSFDEP